MSGEKHIHLPRVKRDRWNILPVLALLSIVALSGYGRQAQAAAYATGGSGQFRNQVLWLTWGGGVNGTHNQVLANGATSTASLTIGTSTLAINCRLGDITRLDNNGGIPGGIRSYRPGSWEGDGLDNLYNIGGTGASNQLVSGISNVNVSRRYSFTVTCASTLNGLAYDLPGLVIADAEQSSFNTSLGSAEYVQGTAVGSWSIVERAASGTCANRAYNGILNGTGQVLRLQAANTSINDCTNAADQNNYGPMGVSFLTFDNAAYTGANRQVTMTFEFQGNGISAVAIGLLAPYADFSDAPASYTSAVHLIDPALSADGLSPGATTNIMAAGFTLSTFTNPTTDKLGARLDADGTNLIGNVGATTDDITGVDDEDAVNIGALPALGVTSDGQTFTVPATCTGTGSVAGWIDFNVDGDFADSNERSTNTPVCAAGGTTVNLTFTVPTGANLVAGDSYLRVRYSLNPAADFTTAGGAVRSGEVEDHALTILPATVKIQKTTTGGTGTFSFATTNLATTPVALNTGTSNPITSAANAIQATANVTLTETVPAGWALTAATCTDANSAVTGNTGNFGTLAGNVLTIPQANVKAGADITCAFTNARPRVRLQKSLPGGRVLPTDQFALSIAGLRNGTATTATATTTGTGTTATGTVDFSPADAAASYTVSETAAGTTVLALYNPSYSCTNATAGSATVLPSGSGSSFTLGPVAAADDITCTFSNARQLSTSMTVRKTTTAGTGTFAFSGTNGFVAQNITAVTAGTPTAGATQALAAPLTATSITEGAPPAGYSLTGITCTGIGAGGTVTPNLGTRTVALDAVAVGAGNNIVCTFTNALSADLSITKQNADPSGGTVVSGSTTIYTVLVTNRGPGTVVNAIAGDTATAGLSGCAVITTPTHCTVVSGTATCPAAASLTYPNLSTTGVPVPSMSANSSIRFQVTCNVN